MRGAPNWRCTSDPVNGEWKQQLLVWLGEVCNVKTLIETGTCEGSTPLAVAAHFNEIYTAELHPGLYETSRQRLSHLGHVHLFHSDSSAFLRGLLPNISPEIPLLFWLDAHPSGPHTAGDGTELARELAAIAEFCVSPLVVIDDEKSAELLQVAATGVSLDGWTREYRTGEVIMHKGGYVIPPFDGDDI